jgi:putative FmdB family regulatory protein
MPLYEYQCDACSTRFERIQKFSDPPVETCPSCGGTVRKLLSSPAIQFKGSGWYITDYARKGGAKGSEGKGPAEGKAPADGKTSSESTASGDSKTSSGSSADSGSTGSTPAPKSTT